MKTNLFLPLLRKLKIHFFSLTRTGKTTSVLPHPAATIGLHDDAPKESKNDVPHDAFLLTQHHSASECIAMIHDAAIRGKDKASRCRNFIRLDGEFINLKGCKNDRMRAERINKYLPEGMAKIKSTDLAKARQNPMH